MSLMKALFLIQDGGWQMATKPGEPGRLVAGWRMSWLLDFDHGPLIIQEGAASWLEAGGCVCTCLNRTQMYAQFNNNSTWTSALLLHIKS